MANLGGTASTEIDAPIEVCWAVVQDVASAPEWQAGLTAMDVRERDAQGRVTRAETTSEAKVRQIKSVVHFTYEEPRRVSWRQATGDLKRLDGAWELEALGPDRTRATYRLDGDPGRVLGMLIRGPVEERLREILVAGRPAELEKRVEG